MLVFVILLISGCASQVYESQRAETNWKDPNGVNYKTYSSGQFTLTYSDEWFEPKHYTRDYYFFQLADFKPWIHVAVFDIEEFTNTTDYYELMYDTFYWAFDFDEIEHYVTEDTMVMRGIMIDEEGDEIIVTYKVIVCPDIVLALDVSGLTEEYSETKEMIDKTVKSFKCV